MPTQNRDSIFGLINKVLEMQKALFYILKVGHVPIAEVKFSAILQRMFLILGPCFIYGVTVWMYRYDKNENVLQYEGNSKWLDCIYFIHTLLLALHHFPSVILWQLCGITLHLLAMAITTDEKKNNYYSARGRGSRCVAVFVSRGQTLATVDILFTCRHWWRLYAQEILRIASPGIKILDDLSSLFLFLCYI